MRRIKLLRNRILIQPLTKSGFGKSKLYLMSEGKGDVHYGLVILTGPGYYQSDGKYRPMGYKNGQVVAYGRNAGTEIEDETEKPPVKYRVITDDDVYAILKVKKKLVPLQFADDERNSLLESSQKSLW